MGGETEVVGKREEPHPSSLGKGYSYQDHQPHGKPFRWATSSRRPALEGGSTVG